MNHSNNTPATFLDFKIYSASALDHFSAIPFALVVLTGLVGNSLVIAVVRRTRPMHTTTNFLLVNLAVADILILVWNPRWLSFVIYPVHPRGALGNFVCQIYTGNSIIGIGIAAAILTLVLLAIERYNALVNAMKSIKITNETLPRFIGCIWSISVLISIPDFFETRFSEAYEKCVCPFSLEEVTSLRIPVISRIICLGVLPFVVLSFCYLQILKGLFLTKTIFAGSTGTNKENYILKKKLAKLSLTVSCVFYICFGPYAAFLLVLAAKDRRSVVQNESVLSLLLRVCELLVTLSSCLNPIVYAFQSSSYRTGFMRILHRQTGVNPTYS